MEKTIGERIREERQKQYIEVKELAKMVGRHYITIYNYETGYRRPAREGYQKDSEALGVKISELTGEGNE